MYTQRPRPIYPDGCIILKDYNAGRSKRWGTKHALKDPLQKNIYMRSSHIFFSMYFESEVDTVHNMLGRNMVDDRSRDQEKLLAFTYPVQLLGDYKG